MALKWTAAHRPAWLCAIHQQECMMPKRSKTGTWKASNGRYYKRYKDAKRAERRSRQTPAGHRAKKRRNARRTKRKRR